MGLVYLTHLMFLRLKQGCKKIGTVGRFVSNRKVWVKRPKLLQIVLFLEQYNDVEGPKESDIALKVHFNDIYPYI